MEIKVKSVLTKSGLPDSDWCINPYLGCTHGCLYCYARFMYRFANRDQNEWGQAVDVKINAPEILARQLTNKKSRKLNLGIVHIGSVCDPYQPAEKKYQITKKILKELLTYPKNKLKLSILTKSDLITRDINLLKKFKSLEAGITISSLNKKMQQVFEPGAPSPEKRLLALKKLKQAGITTYAFIGPIMPGLTEPKKVIKACQPWADQIWLENLNVRTGSWPKIIKTIKNNFPELETEYLAMKDNYHGYWDKVENDLKLFGLKNKVNLKFVFHHKASYQ